MACSELFHFLQATTLQNVLNCKFAINQLHVDFISKDCKCHYKVGQLEVRYRGFIQAILMSVRQHEKVDLLIEFWKSIFIKFYFKKFWHWNFVQNTLAYSLVPNDSPPPPVFKFSVFCRTHHPPLPLPQPFLIWTPHLLIFQILFCRYFRDC